VYVSVSVPLLLGATTWTVAVADAVLDCAEIVTLVGGTSEGMVSVAEKVPWLETVVTGEPPPLPLDDPPPVGFVALQLYPTLTGPSFRGNDEPVIVTVLPGLIVGGDTVMVAFRLPMMVPPPVFSGACAATVAAV
jgi:hypothetical protein